MPQQRLTPKFNLSRAFSITGWMSETELSFLAETASKSKLIVEAGSFQGKSARAMADNTDGVIYAVDPWKPMPLTSGIGFSMGVGTDNMTFTRFVLNLNDHIKSGKVIPTPKKFTDFEIPEDVDFIFIDALHDYKNIKQDIFHALQTMKRGILAGHDYDPKNWPGVVQAVDEYFPDCKKIDTIWMVEING